MRIAVSRWVCCSFARCSSPRTHHSWERKGALATREHLEYYHTVRTEHAGTAHVPNLWLSCLAGSYTRRYGTVWKAGNVHYCVISHGAWCTDGHVCMLYSIRTEGILLQHVPKGWFVVVACPRDGSGAHSTKVTLHWPPRGCLSHSCPPIYVQGDGKGQASGSPKPNQHRQAPAPPEAQTQGLGQGLPCAGACWHQGLSPTHPSLCRPDTKQRAAYPVGEVICDTWWHHAY